ncbi:EF-hand domain-containing protein [Sinorhizobium arboris]|uniref:EF-hand domain-containing protein n=1 Tax=Sinorhizobium arboris TaxID=76745 RepID=UPI0004087EFC|nr:EF-hand domain-containing protein [Sinorhizobium arboris]
MSPMKFPAVTALAALMAISTAAAAAAQAPDPIPPAGEMPAEDQGIEPDMEPGDRGGAEGVIQGDQPDMMREDMVRGDRMHGDRMRHRDRMRGMMMHRQMMHRQMMKIMFAITDADNDGALSFEEISTIHKRIFDKVDNNRDGKVTPEEIQGFFHD